MSEIKTGQELILENVLSFRSKMTPDRVQDKMTDIGRYLKNNNVKNNGTLVTTSFSVEIIDGKQVIDMEILIPVDKKPVDLNGYRYKERFHLVNALYLKHIGNPQLIQDSYNLLQHYMEDNKLQPITGGYNVTVKKPGQNGPVDEMETDIYIGINPNSL